MATKWMWLDGLTVMVLMTFINEIWSKKVYLDKYGDCFRKDYMEVETGDVYTIFSVGGEPYDTTLCEMRFKSLENDRLCLSFDKFVIDTCNVKLNVYSDDTSSGTAVAGYDCRTPEIPERVCSKGKYLTVQMRKKTLSHEGYTFQMELREHSSARFTDGFDDYFLSIGLIIAIVVGVIVILVLIACVIVYCGCKNRTYGLLGRRSQKSLSSGRTQFTDVPREPTAPPLEEPPPAYLDQPPPYTESAATSLQTMPPPSAPPVEQKDEPQPV